ncbi:acetyl-CoA hydrolase/transferase C-terminal domain-containing protein, partial [Chloroflexota bacterium]
MRWQEKYRDKLRTPEEAAKLVKSRDRVVVGFMLHPKTLCMALANRKDDLENVTLMSHWVEDFPWFQPGWESSFQVQTGFVTQPTREGHRDRRLDYAPSVFGLSDGLRHKESGRGKLYSDADVFLVKVGPPNEDGWCSFGHHVWYSPVAIQSARTVIAEVCPNLVWTDGDHVHVSDLDYLVEGPTWENVGEESIPSPPPEEAKMSRVIGTHVAELIRDGDTLEIGTGSASEAAMEFFHTKNDLGIDTEMMYVQMIELVRAGVITGRRNNIHPEKHFATSLWTYRGDPRVPPALDYMNHNPAFNLYDVSYMTNVPRIASVDNMVSINNAIGIDLHGQATISHI